MGWEVKAHDNKGKRNRWGNNHQSFPLGERGELQTSSCWEGEELDKAVKALVGSGSRKQRALRRVRNKEQSSRKGFAP